MEVSDGVKGSNSVLGDGEIAGSDITGANGGSDKIASKEVAGRDPTCADGGLDKMPGGLIVDGDEDTGTDELMIPTGSTSE